MHVIHACVKQRRVEDVQDGDESDQRGEQEDPGEGVQEEEVANAAATAAQATVQEKNELRLELLRVPGRAEAGGECTFSFGATELEVHRHWMDAGSVRVLGVSCVLTHLPLHCTGCLPPNVHAQCCFPCQATCTSCPPGTLNQCAAPTFRYEQIERMWTLGLDTSPGTYLVLALKQVDATPQDTPPVVLLFARDDDRKEVARQIRRRNRVSHHDVRTGSIAIQCAYDFNRNHYRGAHAHIVGYPSRPALPVIGNHLGSH